ncbi:MAG: hypothetical protein ACJ74W_23045 [Pyrinomonadaceae bacterium]
MKEENELIVEGEQVEYIFFPGDPLVVSHGQFRFKNESAGAKTCTINSCQFVENDAAVPLDVFHGYAGDTLIKGAVNVPPKSELSIRITFPFREVHVGVRFRYEVRVSVACEGKQYDATSKLNVILEKPGTF